MIAIGGWIEGSARFSEMVFYPELRAKVNRLGALSSLRGLRGAPEVPPLCRETQSLGQQMLERREEMGRTKLC